MAPPGQQLDRWLATQNGEESRQFTLRLTCKYGEHGRYLQDLPGEPCPKTDVTVRAGTAGMGMCVDVTFYTFSPPDADGNDCCVEAVYEER